MAQVLRFSHVDGVKQAEPLKPLEPQKPRSVPENHSAASHIKQSNGFIASSPGFSSGNVLKTGASSQTPINKGMIFRGGVKSGLPTPEVEPMDLISESELPDIELLDETPTKTREELVLEAEMIKQTYINEGIQMRNESEAWADKMIAHAKSDISKMYDDAKIEFEELKTIAKREGYDEGLAEGEKRGYDEGYAKGLRKCKETMKELVVALDEIPIVKEKVFREYERQLFDCIFTISNKIMANCLKQKDKAVISKMLKAAAKSFRNSEYIKITLSKLDVDDMTTTEMDCLREIFKEGQHVEFEVVKDAPPGTLILDNGSEITDAGISTQLKMIENLGKGKFRKQSDDEEE